MKFFNIEDDLVNVDMVMIASTSITGPVERYPRMPFCTLTRWTGGRSFLMMTN